MLCRFFRVKDNNNIHIRSIKKTEYTIPTASGYIKYLFSFAGFGYASIYVCGKIYFT